LQINTAPRATVRQLAVDKDGGHGTDAERLGALGNVNVLHVVNDHFARRARDPTHRVNHVVADNAARAENLNLSFGGHFDRSCASSFGLGYTLELRSPLRGSARTQRMMVVPDPAVRRMRAVLHLNPMPAFSGTIGTIEALRDNAFEPHIAGDAE
jgi:hypothetical protein